MENEIKETVEETTTETIKRFDQVTDDAGNTWVCVKPAKAEEVKEKKPNKAIKILKTAGAAVGGLGLGLLGGALLFGGGGDVAAAAYRDDQTDTDVIDVTPTSDSTMD